MADHIRSAIFSGTLKAGQRVPQDAIATELGVSRLPVREALIALEADGLVTSEPHRGVFVVPIRREDIEDHYRVYGMVQGLATGRAVQRITEPVLDRLQGLHEQMCASDDPDLLHDLNWEFHSLINRTGGSRRVLSVLRQLAHNLPREVYELPPERARSQRGARGKSSRPSAPATRPGRTPPAGSTSATKASSVIAVLRRDGVLTD